MNNVVIHDLTLRDGNHAISHKLTIDDIEDYCKFAENASIPVVEVGHGNGLGASSITLGEASVNDTEMLRVARKHLKNTKLSVHIIPGIATLQRDVIPAIEIGVDIFRIATHCTEGSVAKSHIEYIKRRGKTVYGVFMMSASCTVDKLVEEAKMLKSYGTDTIIIMDSTGSYLPDQVYDRVKRLKELDITVGFHGHNNLGLAVANSIYAIKAGATIIDTTLKGFGAGAGNTPLEIMSTIIDGTCIDIDKVYEKCMSFNYNYPITKPINILTAKYKLFSGFDKHIELACKKHNIPIASFVKFLNESGKLVAGQEDIIRQLGETFRQSLAV